MELKADRRRALHFLFVNWVLKIVVMRRCE
jgi:hypothetical protein